MTITITWWMAWAVIAAVVLVVAWRVSKPTGDWDFVAPLLGVGVVLLLLVAFIAWLIGWGCSHA